jgi:hypothetical protein
VSAEQVRCRHCGGTLMPGGVEHKALEAARQRDRTAERKLAGICRQCVNPATHGAHCEAHAAKNAANSRAVAARRRRLGRCAHCGRPQDHEAVACWDCTHKAAERQRTQRGRTA